MEVLWLQRALNGTAGGPHVSAAPAQDEQAVFMTRACSVPSGKTTWGAPHLEGLPAVCEDMPASGFFQVGWSPDAKGPFHVLANTLEGCPTEPGLQGSSVGGLSGTADVLGI